MSVHDEPDLAGIAEMEVRNELERELADVIPRPDVAAAVIGRYRRERRRKRASLAVALAGIGVPLTVVPLTMAGSGASAGPAGPGGAAAQPGAVLRLSAYTLHLPAAYRLQPCGPAGAAVAGVTAVTAAGGCIVLALTSATGTGREIMAGQCRVRLVPHGLVVTPPRAGAPNLTVTSTSVPEPALERLVVTGLSYAA